MGRTRKQTVVIEGERKGAGPIHRFESDYPRRIVVCRLPRGWMVCDRCQRDFRVWMTDDPLWTRLPPERHGALLCTRCFRDLVPKR